jgi:hypothetical protein
MDTRQAVYDAVRSRIGAVDVGGIVSDAVRQAFDISFHAERLASEFGAVAYEMQRPSVLYRPALSLDGDHYCALYGENIQDGVAGFGKTPAEAMAEFDKEWHKRYEVKK